MLNLGMIAPLSALSVAALVSAATAYSHYGPAEWVGCGTAIYAYPGLRVSFYCSDTAVLRVPESDLWVRHDQACEVRTHDALEALGRPLEEVLAELLPHAYGVEVWEDAFEITPADC